MARAATTDPHIGTVVAGYQIEELIGRGGMSAVYRAEDFTLERKVALKLMSDELSSDERFRERFRLEWRLAASLDHPNVIPIYEAGEADGQLYIAMRYVEGTDLKELLRSEGALEPHRALALLSEADGSTGFGLDDVVAGGPGFVAVGNEARGGDEGIDNALALPGPSEGSRAVVLTSEDGLLWNRIPEEKLPEEGANVALRGITTGEPGLVAVGYRREEPGVLDGDINPVVWTSPDGLTWTEAADPDGVFSQPGGQLMWAVTAGGPGLVALGQDGDSKGYNTAIWTSP